MIWEIDSGGIFCFSNEHKVVLVLYGCLACLLLSKSMASYSSIFFVSSSTSLSSWNFIEFSLPISGSLNEGLVQVPKFLCLLYNHVNVLFGCEALPLQLTIKILQHAKILIAHSPIPDRGSSIFAGSYYLIYNWLYGLSLAINLSLPKGKLMAFVTFLSTDSSVLRLLIYRAISFCLDGIN